MATKAAIYVISNLSRSIQVLKLIMRKVDCFYQSLKKHLVDVLIHRLRIVRRTELMKSLFMLSLVFVFIVMKASYSYWGPHLNGVQLVNRRRDNMKEGIIIVNYREDSIRIQTKERSTYPNYAKRKEINSTASERWRMNFNYTSHGGEKITTNISIERDNETKSTRISTECQVPPGGFRAWSKGVVTSFEPEVEVNCSRVIFGDEEELFKVEFVMARWKNSLSNHALMRKMENCSWLRDYFSYNLYNSKLEKSFPLAFTFVVYNSPQQVLRLLRLLYRPQNSYCIHCDTRSHYKKFFQKIANCFENIITPSKVENVVWGYKTIMEAQMDCMTDLLKLRAKQEHKWRYVINLCGKELPLWTNREIVTRLMRLNGSSSIIPQRVTPEDEENMSRIKYKVLVNKRKKKIQMGRKLGRPPFKYWQLYKSSSYNAISLAMAEYLAFDKNASRIHNFFKKCRSPEEEFYATLYMLPGVPGGYNPSIPRNEYFSVVKAFWTISNSFQEEEYNCKGVVHHNICIITAADLASVTKGKDYLFHNKYFMEVDHTVMTCMEERIVARNKLEYRKECG